MEMQMDADLQGILLKIARKRSALTQKPSGASGQTRSPAGIDARDQEKHIKALEFAGIGKRYQGITFESIERRGLPPDWDIRQNYKAVKAYADDIRQNVKRGYGLILAGNYGTLKTTMAVAVMRHWMRVQEGGCIMVPMCSLIDNLFTMRALKRSGHGTSDASAQRRSSSSMTSAVRTSTKAGCSARSTASSPSVTTRCCRSS